MSIERQALKCRDCGAVTDMSDGVAADGHTCPVPECGSISTEVVWVHEASEADQAGG